MTPQFKKKWDPGYDPEHCVDLPYLLDIMEVRSSSTDAFIESLPFSTRDITAGTENEFQAAVLGKRQDIDLAITIEESSFYKNLIRRAASGDTSRGKISGLEKYLSQEKDDIWENSWVRFPRSFLNTYANHIFISDLKSDKTSPESCDRSDAGNFIYTSGNEEFIRIPVSYLLKLALADALGSDPGLHHFIRITGEKMMAHYLNDNSSPEIFSFYPSGADSSKSVGKKTAREALIRFLFTQLLVQYAEDTFKLKEFGQQVRVFFSSSPPLMQRQLNECISDSFYRHLFMSPCLSGWTRGKEKSNYMKLCHKVLSRSQINGISKLKEAGIINSNLVVLPNSSNISLANNGTHISIGSRKLGRLLDDPSSEYTAFHEKYLGDLVIKITEHFLCLFPGTYSASPCRLGFEDFHPEKALGFLPHELDYTHLRMIWRRWKRKAKISILGHPVTPFGPVWLDRLISKGFFLSGDFVPDIRLIDYFVSLMSTDQSPALNGKHGSGEQLKKDLSQMGIFDTRMPLYQLVRLRKFSQMGYSGFEHRHYSTFENLESDMGGALDLQNLMTILAYHYILKGKITHSMIPDTPDVESERRQFFFGSAINLPTFFVKTGTRNLFLKMILTQIPSNRKSRRYPGYTRVKLLDYKKALIRMIRKDGQDLIQTMHLQSTLSDLEARIHSPASFSTSGKLVREILARGRKKNPIKMNSEQFNKKAEKYYINDLRKNHITQGFKVLSDEFDRMDLWAGFREPGFRDVIKTILKEKELLPFFEEVKKQFCENSLPRENLKKMMFLIILYVNKEIKNFERYNFKEK